MEYKIVTLSHSLMETRAWILRERPFRVPTIPHVLRQDVHNTTDEEFRFELASVLRRLLRQIEREQANGVDILVSLNYIKSHLDSRFSGNFELQGRTRPEFASIEERGEQSVNTQQMEHEPQVGEGDANRFMRKSALVQPTALSALDLRPERRVDLSTGDDSTSAYDQYFSSWASELGARQVTNISTPSEVDEPAVRPESLVTFYWVVAKYPERQVRYILEAPIYREEGYRSVPEGIYSRSSALAKELGILTALRSGEDPPFEIISAFAPGFRELQVELAELDEWKTAMHFVLDARHSRSDATRHSTNVG